MTSPLSTYLNEHLAGAAGALALLRRLARRFRDPFLRDLLVEIAADQRTLEQLTKDLGIRPRRLTHRAAAGGATAVSWRDRIKGARQTPFELFHGLELLVIGINGKRCLWRALRVIAGAHPSLERLDLSSLEQRAVDQMTRVETQRLALAREALIT